MLPILATLKGWKYGFHSPFKAEVYFVNTRLFTDMKWGTPNPVIVRDRYAGALRSAGLAKTVPVQMALLINVLIRSEFSLVSALDTGPSSSWAFRSATRSASRSIVHLP